MTLSESANPFEREFFCPIIEKLRPGMIPDEHVYAICCPPESACDAISGFHFVTTEATANIDDSIVRNAFRIKT